MVRLSVILTTYDRPDALEAVLRGFAAQTDEEFEIVVADDGSGPATAAVIEQTRQRMICPLMHVRQDHQGFRAGLSRNRAVLRAGGDYLVFVDGDCIPFPDFIARHRALVEPKRFVVGNRILLSERLTQRVLAGGIEPWRLGMWAFIGARLRGDINRTMPLLRLPDGPHRAWQAKRWQGAKTCNLGVWRADFERVNGFDLSYEGWGHEDADLVARLLRSGVQRKNGHFAVPLLHLHHPPADRGDEDGNRVRLAAAIRSEATWAERGLVESANAP